MTYKTMLKQLSLGFVCGRSGWFVKDHLIKKGFIFKNVYLVKNGKAEKYIPTEEDKKANDWMIGGQDETFRKIKAN